MLLTMKLTWQCIFSPKLYKIYRDGALEELYQPQGTEKWADKIITMANTIMNISLYTSPFICMYVYKRGFFTIDESKSIAWFFGGVSCLIFLSFILRGYGRATNAKYAQFIRDLNSSKSDKTAYIAGIRKYDFEFSTWPVSYNVESKMSTQWFEKSPFSACANPELPHYQRSTIQVLAYVATHTFALRLIYPGSLGIIHNLLWNPLLQGRAQLVEGFNGQRSKIQTADDNVIDTMFVDNRGVTSKGGTLVICCEGNSGFYEVGIMTTPIKAGYSAIGWNHPGFAGSTGLPYPTQEHNAIDAVLQYAINELNFKPKDIVMFGWSIGGYTASWAAANYSVKALILDASFDDLLPLAQNQMPSSWSLLVKEVVRSYVDLNIANLVNQYKGPVRLVRRTQDEIICLTPGNLSSNRGNYLLLNLITHHYPEMIDQVDILEKYIAMKESQRANLTTVDKGEMHMLELISKHMMDLRSTHCTPLPEDRFQFLMDSIAADKFKYED